MRDLRDGPPRRSTARLVVASLLLVIPLLVAPRPSAGQAGTGLLLVTSGASGPPGASVTLAELARTVDWPHGPVAVRIATEGTLEDAMAAGPEDLFGGAVRQVVVVPVLGTDAPAPPVGFRFPEGADPTHRVWVGRAVRADPVAGGEGAAERSPEGEAGEERDARVAAGPPSDLVEGVRRAAEEGARRTSLAGERLYRLEGINVTATRGPRDVFDTPAPVSVLDGDLLGARALRGPIDLFRRVPGLDMDGVGSVRRQPVVRGFTGQRVLVLEDGLRLSHSRRRLGSVEPAALAGIGTFERVEVIRGPASVLYGSDAIGGVVNLVTRGAPPPDRARGVAGTVRLVGATAGDAGRGTLDLVGGAGPVTARISGSLARSSAYRAPGGRFGDVTLADGPLVHDTGGRQRQLRAALRLDPGGRWSGLARLEAYRGDETGFGFIDPEALGADPVRVRLTFPDHDYERVVLGARGRELDHLLADAVDVSAYTQWNDRTFITEVHAPMGPGAPPGAAVDVESENLTRLRTRGGRLEARRALGERHLLTYGIDVHRDRALGADTTTTTVIGFGPDRVEVEGGSSVPNAVLTGVGVFAQDQWTPDAATEVVLGLRYQDVRARTLDSVEGDAAAGSTSESTLVGSASLLRRVGPGVNVVASVARGFRSPNLVERFFSGPTPGGRGVWVRNPELEAETSLNLDLGLRVRRTRVSAEAFVFRSTLRNGIRLEPTGREVDGVPEHRNENVDELEVWGLEGWTAWSPLDALTLTAGATLLDRSNPVDPDDPLEEGRRLRVTGSAAGTLLSGRLRLEYALRWHDAQRETLDGTSPVGEEVPAYAVHDLHVDLTLPWGDEVGLSVENLFDRLYAEAANAGFFRPEPGRNLVLRWMSRF